ncbi:MAG: TonB-dependent receptor, partial [Muribaculaceae bacterium]
MQSLAQFAVKGIVADSTGTGEAYATIRIYNLPDTTKAIRLGTTADDGTFSQSLPAAGKYSINISSVGKSPLFHNFEVTKSNPIANLGTLTISDASTTLGEVQVVAQRPLVKTEIDRLSYDVQADEDSKTNTIFEMLKKVPRVTVDGEDNIKVDGSSDFKIFKNGRPNSSWSRNPKEVLKSIPASMIKRIEVITEPGAKYDAEGVSGILNIVTMDNTSMSGMIGSIGGAVNQKGSTNINTYLTTQTGKLTTSINYGYNYMAPGNAGSHSENYRLFTDSKNEILDRNQARNHGYIHFGNIESSLDIDTLNLVTLSFGGYYYNFNVNSLSTNTMRDAAGNPIYGYNSHYFSPQYSYFDFNGKLDYQHLTHRKDEALTFSYLLSTTNQIQKWQTDYDDISGDFPIGYEHKFADDRLKFYEHTFQFDWTRPFAGGHKLETGAKYILRINNSKTYQTFDQTLLNDTTDFHHTTHVGALYSEYSYNSTRWGARAGLRYEIARMGASYPDGSQPSFHSTLNDLVPTLSASYKINNANTLKLNYASRIARPGIAYLNPAIIGDAYNVKQGNPNLESARSHSINLDYTLMIPKLVLNIALNHRFSNGLIQSVVT